VVAALSFAAPVIALVYCKRRKRQDFFFDVAGRLIKRKDGLHMIKAAYDNHK